MDRRGVLPFCFLLLRIVHGSWPLNVFALGLAAAYFMSLSPLTMAKVFGIWHLFTGLQCNAVPPLGQLFTDPFLSFGLPFLAEKLRFLWGMIIPVSASGLMPALWPRLLQSWGRLAWVRPMPTAFRFCNLPPHTVGRFIIPFFVMIWRILPPGCIEGGARMASLISLSVVRVVVMRLRAHPDLGGRAERDSPVPVPRIFASRPPRLAARRLQDPAAALAFVSSAAEALRREPSPSFASLPSVLWFSAERTIGTVSSSRSDWRDGHEDELAQVSRARQLAFDEYRAHPGDPARRHALQVARHASRHCTRCLKAAWWQGQFARLEAAARRRDAHRLYNDAKVLGRLFRNKGLHIAPLACQHTLPQISCWNHLHSLSLMAFGILPL